MTFLDGSPRSGGASMRRPHLPVALLLVLVGGSLWTLLQQQGNPRGSPFATREINLQPLAQPPPSQEAALPLSSHKVRPWQLVAAHASLAAGPAGHSLLLLCTRPAVDASPAAPRCNASAAGAPQCTATKNDNHRVCQYSNLILHGGTVYYLTDGEQRWWWSSWQGRLRGPSGSENASQPCVAHTRALQGAAAPTSALACMWRGCSPIPGCAYLTTRPGHCRFRPRPGPGAAHRGCDLPPGRGREVCAHGAAAQPGGLPAARPECERGAQRANVDLGPPGACMGNERRVGPAWALSPGS